MTYAHPGSVRKARNYRCLHCKAVMSTPQGINGHLWRRHGVPTDQIKHAVDWGVTKADACDNKPSPVAER